MENTSDFHFRCTYYISKYFVCSRLLFVLGTGWTQRSLLRVQEAERSVRWKIPLSKGSKVVKICHQYRSMHSPGDTYAGKLNLIGTSKTLFLKDI